MYVFKHYKVESKIVTSMPITLQTNHSKAMIFSSLPVKRVAVSECIIGVNEFWTKNLQF